jgi:hypothetical protein
MMPQASLRLHAVVEGQGFDNLRPVALTTDGVPVSFAWVKV